MILCIPLNVTKQNINYKLISLHFTLIWNIQFQPPMGGFQPYSAHRIHTKLDTIFTIRSPIQRGWSPPNMRLSIYISMQNLLSFLIKTACLGVRFFFQLFSIFYFNSYLTCNPTQCNPIGYPTLIFFQPVFHTLIT